MSNIKVKVKVYQQFGRTHAKVQYQKLNNRWADFGKRVDSWDLDRSKCGVNVFFTEQEIVAQCVSYINERFIAPQTRCVMDFANGQQNEGTLVWA